MQFESAVQPAPLIRLSDKLQFVVPQADVDTTEACRTSFPLTIYRKGSYHHLL
jgi:hypothetical protein